MCEKASISRNQVVVDKMGGSTDKANGKIDFPIRGKIG
jgi:hypothetical protein